MIAAHLGLALLVPNVVALSRLVLLIVGLELQVRLRRGAVPRARARRRVPPLRQPSPGASCPSVGRCTRRDDATTTRTVTARRAAGARHKGRLAAAFVLLATFMVVELSRAPHQLAGAALRRRPHAHRRARPRHGPRRHPARRVAARQHRHRTFGLYRLEILAALANAVLLFGVAVYVLVEAIRRIGDPPEVLGGPMLVVATLGLVANLVAFALLREGASESLNVEGAYLEVLADTVGSVGVIVGAIVDPAHRLDVGRPGGRRRHRAVDPPADLAARRARRCASWSRRRRRASTSTPIEADLGWLDGVVDVHDLHVWTLTSDMEAATAHLMVRTGTDGHAVLDQARALLIDDYNIIHATLQVEPDDHTGCDEVAW